MAGFYLVELDVIDRSTDRHDIVEFIDYASSSESAAQKGCEFVMADIEYELMAVESVKYLGTRI